VRQQGINEKAKHVGGSVRYHGNELRNLLIDHKIVSSCAENCAEFNGGKITLII